MYETMRAWETMALDEQSNVPGELSFGPLPHPFLPQVAHRLDDGQADLDVDATASAHLGLEFGFPQVALTEVEPP